MANILIFDTRLSTSPEGVVLATTVVPKTPGDVTIDSNGSKPTDAIIAETAAAARGLGSPKILTIMCHGRSQDRMEKSVGTTQGMVGGAGLDIGTPGLTEGNLSLVRQWSGYFTQILLLACAVGYHESKASPFETKFNGAVFCGQLAVKTGATVIASSALQQYDVIPATLKSIFTREIGEVDFGPWEGVVSSYDPKSGESRLYIP